jgi:hypothetical protein
MTTSTKPIPRNTYFSIAENFDPDSTVYDERDLHSEKHFLPKISSDEGIMISPKPGL